MATEPTTTAQAPVVKVRKKKKRLVPRGRAYVQATYNNTIVTLTDLKGDVIAWSSAGKNGFKGPKKSTPYAAGIISRAAVEKARDYGLKEVDVFVKGVGSGREAAVRALHANGLEVLAIKDMTPIPHNGCRPKKARRV
jgi:small subunit ribosomal protein S11